MTGVGFNSASSLSVFNDLGDKNLYSSVGKLIAIASLFVFKVKLGSSLLLSRTSSGYMYDYSFLGVDKAW